MPHGLELYGGVVVGVVRRQMEPLRGSLGVPLLFI